MKKTRSLDVIGHYTVRVEDCERLAQRYARFSSGDGQRLGVPRSIGIREGNGPEQRSTARKCAQGTVIGDAQRTILGTDGSLENLRCLPLAPKPSTPVSSCRTETLPTRGPQTGEVELLRTSAPARGQGERAIAKDFVSCFGGIIILAVARTG